MKRVFGVFVSLTVALGGWMYLTRGGHTLPAPEPWQPRVTPLAAPATTAEPVLQSAVHNEAEIPTVEPESSQKRDTTQEAIAALQRETVRLRRQVAALQRQRHEPGRAAAVGAPEQEDNASQDPRTSTVARLEADREHQEHMAVVEATFQQEPAHTAWAFEATEAVETVLASDALLQTAIQHLECRSHTCRVEVADADTGEMPKLLPMFLHQLAQTLPYVTANQVEYEDGSKSLILYLSAATNSPAQPGR